GHEAAGVVDELGEDVADVVVGDRVFGFSPEGAAQAELRVLPACALTPPSLDFPDAAALPAAVETATRALDQLGVGSGSTLLINGASGSVGGPRAPSPPARAGRASPPLWPRGWRVRPPPPGPATTPFARWGPSPSPTARAWPGGFARSRRTASTPRSTSPGAASCPSSSSSRAVGNTSGRWPTSAP